MAGLSRRDFVERLASAYVATLWGCRKKTDWFARELVCVHVFDPREMLPPPLVQRATRPASRSATQESFSVGLPELVLCRTQRKFLDLFPYFWPISLADFEQIGKLIEILYHKDVLEGTADTDAFAEYVRTHTSDLLQPGSSAAVIFTFHDFTRHLAPAVVSVCQHANIAEFILFKDPSRAPYFCDYPAKQRGFKRPPP
jgi:hypothetical protein